VEKKDKTKELFGCIVFMARFIAALAAIGGGIRGIFSGDFLGAIWAVGLAALFYGVVVAGTTLILKVMERRKDAS
jgi:hypothetical protein